MASGNAKFLIGLGIGSAIGALVYHFSRTAKAQKLKGDVLNVLHEIEVDAESALVSAKQRAAHTGSKVAGRVAEKATEIKEKLDGK